MRDLEKVLKALANRRRLDILKYLKGNQPPRGKPTGYEAEWPPGLTARV
ncbi:MAG: hypothetical protein AAB691_02710 [Patescibacteria group bacterium]